MCPATYPQTHANTPLSYQIRQGSEAIDTPRPDNHASSLILNLKEHRVVNTEYCTKRQ